MALAGVAAAYYFGAVLGSALRFPPATTSVFWPPNSILTAALLLVAPRHFGRVVLAALPAHFAAQLPAGLPLGLSASFFVTNCSEALLAAGLVHRWSDDPSAFDTLRRVIVFIACAVLLAPLATTFADAAAVHAFRGEPFDVVFIRRLFSNTLGQLVLVPCLVILVRHGPRWLREASPRRRAEVALFALAHLAIGGLVLHAYHDGFDLPGGSFTALPLLMPLLVVAAVRYGPGGSSLALVAAALLATGIAVSRAAASGPMQAEERVRALQVFLVVVGIPLLCLSALVEERGRAAATLRQRLRFEELVSEISASFVHVPSEGMRVVFAAALARLRTFLGLEAVVLRAGAITCVDRAGAAEDGLADDEWRRGLGPRDVLDLPLEAAGQDLGCLTLVSRARAWRGDETEGAARLVADVFASALARWRTEEALRASEVMNSAVLASLSQHVAVLDRSGTIIAVNPAWTRFMQENCRQGEAAVGENYLDHLREAGGPRPHHLLEIGTAIENVLARRAPAFTGEYMTPVGDRWVSVTVVPLHRPEGGVVLSYTDVDERHQAEAQASQLRDELAHCLRLSTIGELTSSIAHELNQPLAAILANAQAARRLMAGGTRARNAELEEILEDIISEDRRAGEVIRTARQLLRKGARAQADVDLNLLVREVLRLVANDALIREVSLRRTLELTGVMVRGDRVQLQQVLLNLLVNALEAMPERPGERLVCVSTAKSPSGMATVSVADTGRGLTADAVGAIFEPFYTTKPDGLGMGLSISRSIVEAHGGTITAASGLRGGATVSFTLPLAASQPELTTGPS
jgi:signal transduction histidine kinase